MSRGRSGKRNGDNRVGSFGRLFDVGVCVSVVVVVLTDARIGSSNSFWRRVMSVEISGIKVRSGPFKDFTVFFMFNATFDTSNDAELYNKYHDGNYVSPTGFSQSFVTKTYQ